jgi:hypothetical protein
MVTAVLELVFLLYPQKLALASPTSGARSVGIVHPRTKATELVPPVSCFDITLTKGGIVIGPTEKFPQQYADVGLNTEKKWGDSACPHPWTSALRLIVTSEMFSL